MTSEGRGWLTSARNSGRFRRESGWAAVIAHHLNKKGKKIKGPNVCEEREGAGLVRESRAAAIDRALGTS